MRTFFTHVLASGTLATLACAVLIAPPARADVFFLKTGKIEGKEVERAEGRVTIRQANGIAVTVDEKDILGIEERQTPREVYRAMAAKLKPDDAEGHYALAMWCRDHELRDGMTAELAAVLRTDPDHERARTILGYVKTDDGWMTREEAMKAKGMVLVDGRWLPKEEAERLERKKATKQLVLAVNRMVSKIRSGPKAERTKWEDRLATFNKPAVAWRMLRLLEDRSPAVRRAACRSLGRMRHRDALSALVGRAVFDSEETVRVAALVAMRQIDATDANDRLYQLISGLKVQPITTLSDQRSVKRLYRRIAQALGILADVRSVPWLISILYPNVEIKGASAGTNVGMTRGGGGGVGVDAADGHLTVGTGAVVEVPANADRYYFNTAAEEALKNLTGQKLGVRPSAWREWWRENGAELLRKAEAKKRGGHDRAKALLDETADDKEAPGGNK